MTKPTSTWQIQEAQQCFSEVVRRAEREGPQRITKRGEETAWLISARDYQLLKKHKHNLTEFFQRSPHRDVEIIAERSKDKPRKVRL